MISNLLPLLQQLPVFPPAFIMIFGALLLPLVPAFIRKPIILILPVLTLTMVWLVPEGDIPQWRLPLMGMDHPLTLLYVHDFTRIFATVFAIAAWMAALFGLNQSSLRETVVAFTYAGGAIGVLFSGDLISMFLFWELMAIGATLVIFASNQPKSRDAGLRYAMFHFLGGVFLMCGIVLHIMLSGDPTISAIQAVNWQVLSAVQPMDMSTLSVWLILIGILFNVGAPPFAAWLPDAYPEASPVGAVYLSAFTTKTAVFLLLLLFPGTDVLIYIGLFMIFYGIIYAIMENDIRRILAYTVIAQVGFMVTGVGIGSEDALLSVAVLAFCSVIYKGLLFMVTGAVMYQTGKRRCTELGGLSHSMPLTTIFCIIAALAISAFPFTTGFVSKSMISSATANANLSIVWFLFLAASAGTVLYVSIKLPWFVFFQKDSGLRPKDPPWNMSLAMFFMAALCIVPAIPGVTEVALQALLPIEKPLYNAYTSEHIVTQLQLLIFAGAAFFLMLPLLKRANTISLDFDWFYRVFAMYLIQLLMLLWRLPMDMARFTLKHTKRKALQGYEEIAYGNGAFSRNWPMGFAAGTMAAMLGLYLAIVLV